LTSRRGLHSTSRLLAVVLGAGAALSAFACEPGGDVREWTPRDHDNTKGNPGSMQTSGATDNESATLVSVTWRQNCVRCHGPRGRGDGPEGPMMRVPDLARTETQGRSDEELAGIIRNGRNKMPGFGTLPPNVIELLVAHVRTFSR
jgi:cytochrome c oxidase cbb3-type subunit 3